MNASNQALAIIRKYEGLSLVSYQDTNGEWTIGYGQTGPHITSGLLITDIEAEQWLKNRTTELSDQITDLLKVPVNQSQFDALVSLSYNIGIGAFKHSSLLKLLNNKDYHGAGQQLLAWTHSQGVELPGLRNRRLAEYQLYNQ